MIKSFTFTNYLEEALTVTLKEAEPDHGLLIRSVEGLGPVVSTINTTEIVNLDGEIFNSSKRQKRNIVINFIFTGTDIESVRQLTYKYFPEKKNITILVETDNRIAEAYGYVEKNEPDIFSEEEGCQISVICSDPNFYDAENKYQIGRFFGAEPLFEFPFENDSLTENLIEFGEKTDDKEANIVYDGEVETGILIHIYFLASITALYFYNITQKQKMILNFNKLSGIIGSQAQKGDEILISTVPGDKYIKFIRGSTAKNVFNIVDKTSDWIELHKGNNLLMYETVGDRKNVQVLTENRIVYRGI